MARLLTAALVAASSLVVVAVASAQTSAATSAVLVKDIDPGTGGSDPQLLIDVDGTLFFSASDGTHGTELWKSDGTATGTGLIRDINPGPASSIPGAFRRRWASVNGTVFFTGDDGVHGRELWKSDGTASGTSLVADINPGPEGSDPGRLIDFNGTLYFSADDGVQGREPWMSDGSSAGTGLLRDVVPVTSGDGFEEAMAVGDTLFFTAADPDNGPYQGTFGEQLWKTDGTAAGTVFVARIGGACCDRLTTFLTEFRGLAIFTKRSACCGGRRFWRSDGTPEGTFYFSDGILRNVTILNAELYYFNSPFDPAEFGSAALLRSDATVAGTTLVTRITPDIPSDVVGATVVEGKLLFFRYTVWPLPGMLSLWTSDGTAEGTIPVGDIGTLDFNNSFNFPHNVSVTQLGRAVFLDLPVANTGVELWKTDGTLTGTHLVRDIKIGEDGSSPGPYAAVRGTLFFGADDGVHGRELWKTTPPLPTKPRRSDYKNASQYCKALREFFGDAVFSQRYRNHGECVRANH